jgi:diadenosine tetraphosphatase ApaH/serine/threonine PP2A family protein phosphatase
VRYLIVSDVHGNREAIEAVMADCAGQYDRILCCGDLIGYGPDPNPVIDWARRHVDSVIRGNHDRACCGLDNLEWFNPIAQEASRWTMAQLTKSNLEWLRALPQGPVVVDGFLMAHGSPLDEDEYLISLEDAENVFSYLESNLTFFGHTHLQGGFAWVNGSRHAVGRPYPFESTTYIHIDPDGAYLINPGSVGQPRDGDPRASYALYDSQKRDLSLCRVPYDYEAVRQKIETAGLPPGLGTRLALGR